MRRQITFYLNGVRQDVGPDQAKTMLADYLRYQRGMTGTKIVCAEGDCGACTVLRKFPRSLLGRGKGFPKELFLPINACISTLGQLDGSFLVTVEALGRASTELAPVQRTLLESHGTQCGFCTPGFVMALAGLVEKKRACGEKSISAQEAKNALTGNLCRCTGYQPIIEAAQKVDLEGSPALTRKFESRQALQDLKKILAKPLLLEGGKSLFFAPKNLKDAAKFLRRYPDAVVVAGGTDLGVLANKRKASFERTLSLHLVPELYEIRSTRGRLWVGARVTLSELRTAVKKSIPELARYIDVFASPQIKNVATLVGNVGNASPIGDMPPFLLAADAVVHVQGRLKSHKIPIDQFFVSYRKTALKKGEFITGIEFDIPSAKDLFRLHKVAQRKDLDISAVNMAVRVFWKNRAARSIADVRIAVGGVAATPLRLKKTELLLRGETIDLDLMKQAVLSLHQEITPLSDLRGSSAYRRVVAENLFLKSFREAP